MKGTPLAARGAIYLVQLYRNTISPLRLPTCRFTPSCSQYTVDALTEYGVVRGGGLALARLVKCGPWHRGGWDPIPERWGYSPRKRWAHPPEGQGTGSCASRSDSSADAAAADEVWGTPAKRGESKPRV